MSLLFRLGLFLLLGSFSALEAAETARLLIIGDSITAGHGLAPNEAYPALLQKKLDALRPGWTVVNAGISGDTSAGGLRRMSWLLKQPAPRIVVIALGGNDGLRKSPPADLEKNLQGMVDKARTFSPEPLILLAGMRMPMNFGDYGKDFAAVYPRVAEKNKIPLHPFLLEGVALDPALNQDDMIHPNAKGQAVIAEGLWKTLKPLAEKALEKN